MANGNQVIAGMTLLVNDEVFRVEASVKVAVAKGSSFIRATLKNLVTQDTIEKNFKPDQSVTEVFLAEKKLEYLYPEGEDHLFLDVEELEQVLVSARVVGDRVNYLKEGVEVKAMCYSRVVFLITLPQFLELIVVATDGSAASSSLTHPNRMATLETGAVVKVPWFVEVGDVVRVDTHINEGVQRV